MQSRQSHDDMTLAPSEQNALFAPADGWPAFPCQALDRVTLQLKWLHQFQFADYYVAQAA